MFKNLLFICFAAVMFTACGDDDPMVDPCAGIECGDNGTCVTGTCDCEAGFYGDSCENAIQDLFIGTWNGVDCDGDDYSITIEAGATPEDLVVLNTGLAIEALINNETMFTMPTQTIVEPFFSLEVTVSGDGTLLEDGTLSFAATVQSALGGGSCTSVMTKQ